MHSAIVGLLSGFDTCLSWNLNIQLHHKMCRLTTARLFTHGRFLKLLHVVGFAIHPTCNPNSVCAFLASSKRRFSLVLHMIWSTGFIRFLKSITNWRSGWSMPITLQQVFTCWASIVTDIGGYVKLLLFDIRGCPKHIIHKVHIILEAQNKRKAFRIKGLQAKKRYYSFILWKCMREDK